MQSFNKFSLQLLFRWNHLKSDLDVENDFDDKVGLEDRDVEILTVRELMGLIDYFVCFFFCFCFFYREG